MILDSPSSSSSLSQMYSETSLLFGWRRPEPFAVPPCDVSGAPGVSGAAGRVSAGRGSPTTTAPATVCGRPSAAVSTASHR